MPSLRIKNPEAHRLAVELTRITGESLTTAITVTIKERIERIETKRKTVSSMTVPESASDSVS